MMWQKAPYPSVFPARPPARYGLCKQAPATLLTDDDSVTASIRARFVPCHATAATMSNESINASVTAPAASASATRDERSPSVGAWLAQPRQIPDTENSAPSGVLIKHHQIHGSLCPVRWGMRRAPIGVRNE